jgi:uncharacterized protein (DUF58 family)
MTITAGPVTAASSGLVHALDLVVRRRVENLLAGDHLSTTLGPGTELAQVRPYVAGDDVRFIDWAVTARTNIPHVKVHVAERSLTTWLVLDASPSMRFGTADRTKAEVAEGVAITIGHLGTRGANRLAVTTFGGGGTITLRPTQGRAGLLNLLAALRDADAAAAAAAADEVAGTPAAVATETLGEALNRTARLNRQRGLVIVVADMRGGQPTEWRQPMMAIASRHDVLVVEIRDPREQELPNVGELWLVDPESGRQLRVDTRNRRLRERFAEAAAAERTALARELAVTGTSHLVLSTEGDWLAPLATYLLQRKYQR